MDNSFLESEIHREHGGEVFSWGRKLSLEASEILDFSASINPLGPPSLARKAFVESYSELSLYPDAYAEKLREALARRHEMNPEEVLLGNGSTQLIYLLCQTLRPRKALVVVPAFSEYANALKLAGAEIRFFPLPPDDHFQFSLDQFLAEWEKGRDIAFFATPNSATGQLIPRTEIEEVARAGLRMKSLMVVDEAFIDFVEAESVKELIQENPYLIVLRSLTKYYALPGLRLGYLFAQAQRVKQLAAHQEPWSVNGPAQRVALACLGDASFDLRTREWLEKEGGFLLEGLSRLKGLRPYPSKANFVLVSVENAACTALELRSLLLQKKILIRACDSFLGLGRDYFRVAVRRRKENRLLLKALKDFLG
jgi:threonine-phosphate decarboxylase